MSHNDVVVVVSTEINLDIRRPGRVCNSNSEDILIPRWFWLGPPYRHIDVNIDWTYIPNADIQHTRSIVHEINL